MIMTGSFLDGTNFDVIDRAPDRILYQNNQGTQPRFVEVFDDGSWAAYTSAHVSVKTDVADRVGRGRDDFAQAFRSKPVLRTTISFPSSRDCYLFGNDLYRKTDTEFPTLHRIREIVRDMTGMNNPQAMELLESMKTNTEYPLLVTGNAGLLYTLENIGFVVNHKGA